MAKGKIVVLSHYLFDEKMREWGLNNQNVDNLKDTAFISIIGTRECLEYYLDESKTKHFFMNNHENVLNLDFDDISTDVDYKPKFDWGKFLDGYLKTTNNYTSTVSYAYSSRTYSNYDSCYIY
jgi:hypothetical protein